MHDGRLTAADVYPWEKFPHQLEMPGYIDPFKRITQADIRPSEPFPHPLEEPEYVCSTRDGTPENTREKDDNDEEDEPVDPSVKEDMRKLETSFIGISRRFRLINRIGEGE